MASFDDVLMGGMRGFRKETGQPLDEPEITQVESQQSTDDLRERYDSARNEVVRPTYRGFEIPYGMGIEETEAWADSIDEREDERERKESLSYRVPRALIGPGRYLFGSHADPEEERRVQEEYGFDPVKGEPEFVEDLREGELRKIGYDPIGSMRRAYKIMDEMAEKAILEDDPESARNLADIASFRDPTGVSDLLSGVASTRLAFDDPERFGTHATAAGVSYLAAAIPLVGSGLAKQILLGAPDAAKAAPDAPAPVFEAAAERMVERLPDKISVQALESTLGRKKHPKSGEVVRYTKDVKDKNTGEIIHKKGDKKLTPSGEEILHPEFIYKDISESEWNDTNFDDFINAAKASGKKSVTKDEFIQHLEDNKVQIDEVRLAENAPLPQELQDLSLKKLEASRSLNSESQELAKILAPGENFGTHRHKFERNAYHYHGLYVDYLAKHWDVAENMNRGDVPDDMWEVVSKIKDLENNVPISDLTVEHGALITEVRNAVNAKLADPEYQKFVDQQGIDFSVVNASSVDPDFLKQANKRIEQNYNLRTIASALNNIPEAESRLIALRNFESSPKYQEYASVQNQFRRKAEELMPEIQGKKPEYEIYTVPGGEDYQEILLTVPTKRYTELPEGFEVLDVADVYKNENSRGYYQVFRDGAPVGGSRGMFRTPEEAKQFAIDEINEADGWDNFGKRKKFTDSHHGNIPNVMVHIRTKTRIDSKGRRILFVEEIQSDWHQKGLKRGYTSKPVEVTNIDGKVVGRFATEEKAIEFGNDLEGGFSYRRSVDTVPDAPLKDTKEWTALAIKRIFREAADQGYDGVAFSRSDMITPLVTLPRDEAVGMFGNPETFLDRLAEFKQRGGQFEEGAEQAETVFGGNQYYYDKLIPSIAKKESFVPPDRLPDETTKDYQSRVKAARKARPQTTQIDIEGPSGDKSLEVPFFELTDKVRDRVIKPQKLYSVALPGIAVGAAAAEEEELSAAAALGAIGLGGMALYKGMKGARAAKLEGLTDLKGNTPKLNDDGTITLYHRTTPEAAAEIRRTGKFVSKENTDEIFLSSKPTGQAEGYGSEVVEVRVDPTKVRLDDAFDDEIHVAVKTADVAKPPAATIKEVPKEFEGKVYRLQSIIDSDRYVVVDKGTDNNRATFEYISKGTEDFPSSAPYLVDKKTGQRLDGDFRDERYNPDIVEAKPVLSIDYEEAGIVGDVRQRFQYKITPKEGWLTSLPQDDSLMYRGMSWEEWQDIQKTGKIKSKGEYNLGPEQVGLTYFTSSVDQAISYSDSFAPQQFKATPDKPAVVVAVKKRAGVKVEGTDEKEIGIADDISSDEIVSVWEGHVGTTQAGRTEVISDFHGVRDGSSRGASNRIFWKERSTAPKPPASEDAFGARYEGETAQYTFTAPSKLPEAPEEIQAAFSEMNRIQRGAPESAMESFQINNQAGQGPAGYLAEHIGDLTARLGHRAYGPVAEKVGKTHGDLLMGFETPPLKDVLFDDDYRKLLLDKGYERYSELESLPPKTRDEYVKEFDEYLSNYADKHRNIPVYNEVQRLANDAAVALGEQRYTDVRDSLAKLQKYIDEGEERFTARMSWIEPEFARFPGGETPPGKAVKTELPDFSAEYKEAKEMQDLIERLSASKKASEQRDFLDAILKSPEAKPPAASKLPEEGNPLTEPPEYRPMSYEGGYNQSIDFSETSEIVENILSISNKHQDLFVETSLIEAEYASLSDEDKFGKRGEVLNEWYEKSLDTYSELGDKLDESEYDRYLMGKDVYYETNPNGVQHYDDFRLFSNTGVSVDFMPLDASVRKVQEDKQRQKLKNTIHNGGPMLDLFGPMGELNRYLMKKAMFFEHPVQTIQLNDHQKRMLSMDNNNLESLKDSGLVSYLLYKELLGSVKLL